MYGEPTSRSPRATTTRCHSVIAGNENDSVVEPTAFLSCSVRSRYTAMLYAASARVTGCASWSSSSSSSRGRFTRSPSMRATVSVPSHGRGPSSAARAATRMARAAGRSPASVTSRASSSRTVTGACGSAIEIGPPRLAITVASSLAVSGSAGLNDSTEVAMRPASTTSRSPPPQTSTLWEGARRQPPRRRSPRVPRWGQQGDAWVSYRRSREPSQSFGEVKSDRERSRTLGATYQPPSASSDAAGSTRGKGRGDAEILRAMVAKLS